jgi:hypothetical protein
MAKKKRRRPRSGQPTQPAPAPPAPARQEKKAAKRAQRERERKAEVRKGMFRRALIGGVVGLLVFAAISWFNRPPSATEFRTHVDARNAAIHGGCGDVMTPSADPVRTHLQPGQSYDYADHPATSGPHDPSPLPDQPHVYTDVSTYRETMAVHSLEHGSVVMYYRPTSDPRGLPANVVDALKPVAENGKATYLIPYGQLPGGTALAFTAWNKVLECPNGITADDAVAVASGFVASYECTSNAPEAKAAPC